MRASMDNITQVMKQHLNEDRDDIIERLQLDLEEVSTEYRAGHGPEKTLYFISGLAVGLEIGRTQRTAPDDEHTASDDEFLASLPEADPGYLEST